MVRILSPQLLFVVVVAAFLFAATVRHEEYSKNSPVHEDKNDITNSREQLSVPRQLRKDGGKKGKKNRRTNAPTPSPTDSPTTGPIPLPTEMPSSGSPTRSPTDSPTTGPTPSSSEIPPSSSPTVCGQSIPLPLMPGKKGACFTLRDPTSGKPGTWDENMPKVVALNPYWNYAWSTKRAPNQPSDIEFVPMFWGYYGDAGVERRFEQDVRPQLEAGNVTRILGYNEPDHAAQSNLAVDTVVQSWNLLSSEQIPLASPSVAHINGTWHLDFLQRAQQDCLRFEYHAVHWYGGTCAECFKNRMRLAHELGGYRPLMLTEFAPADWTATSNADNKHTAQKVLDFAKDVIPWMHEQDWIAGYAWFSFKQTEAVGHSSALFDTDGGITKLGEYYASVTSENPLGDQSITI